MSILTITAENNFEVDITVELEQHLSTSGNVVELRGGRWRFTRSLLLAPGSGIIGVGNPTLRALVPPSPLIGPAVMVMTNDGILSNFIFDGDKGSKPNHFSYGVDVMGNANLIEGVRFKNFLSEAIRVYGSQNRFQRLRISDGGRSGIFLRLGAMNVLEDILFERNAHFGVHAWDGANRGSLRNLRMNDNGLELVALMDDTWGFRVSGCHAEGSGDNGLSIGGVGHVVEGNLTLRNAHHGICVFGRDNTITGNRAQNNNQRKLLEPHRTFGGISVTPGFGSLANRNTVVGNWAGDLQGVATQYTGFLASRDLHLLWLPDSVINGNNRWRRNGGRVYRYVGTTIPATTGFVAPTHISGVQSDGELDWKYITGIGGNLDAANNLFVGNVAYRNTDSDFSTTSTLAQEEGQIP